MVDPTPIHNRPDPPPEVPPLAQDGQERDRGNLQNAHQRPAVSTPPRNCIGCEWSRPDVAARGCNDCRGHTCSKLGGVVSRPSRLHGPRDTSAKLGHALPETEVGSHSRRASATGRPHEAVTGGSPVCRVISRFVPSDAPWAPGARVPGAVMRSWSYGDPRNVSCLTTTKPVRPASGQLRGCAHLIRMPLQGRHEFSS
jgi:hypothetical protein